MTYKNILTFNPHEYIGAFKLAISSYYAGVSIAREVSRLEGMLPSSLYLDMPNIRFTIGGDYDRSTNSIMIANKILLASNDNDVFVHSETKPSSISNDTVLINTQSDYGVPVLSEKLLKKGNSEYTVSWFYDSNKINETNISTEEDIPSFKYASAKRFLKKKEFFPGLKAMSVTSSDDSVATFGMLEFNLNRLDDPQIECLPQTIIGRTVSVNKDITITGDNPTAITIGECSIARNTPIVNRSALERKEGESIFLTTTLSNANTLFIEDTPPLEEISVASKEYTSLRSASLFPLKGRNLPLHTSVTGSNNHSICNNSSFVEIVRLKAEETYSRLLKIKITGRDSSTLGELMLYLSQKLEDLKRNFVRMDECSSITLNNINEGCKVECDTLSLSDDNLMVTKQRFRAVVSCAMRCQ